MAKQRNYARHPPAYIPLSLIIFGGLCFVGLALFSLRSVSPYIDTSFQIGISREPSLEAFFRRVAADNQAPGAQFVFWLVARAGLSSDIAQRAVSLLLASSCYLAAILGGTTVHRGKSGEQQNGPKGTIILAAILTILAAGVFPISAFVRYSSFLGPLWLFVFILVDRFRRGETSVAFAIGITTGLAFIVSYTAILLVISVAVALLPDCRNRVAVQKLVIGTIAGLIPLLTWLALAGSAHIHNVFSRVDPAEERLTSRALVGKTYELLAWMFVGPASLPTFAGLLILAVFAMGSLSLVWIAIKREHVHVLPLIAFTVLPLPFLFATKIAAGWSMVGPTAVLAFVAGLGAGRLDRGASVVQAMLIVCTAALSSLPAANLLILRPDAFASRASLAAAAGLQLARDHPSALLVCADWTTCLLTSEATPAQFSGVLNLAQFAAATDKDLSGYIVFLLGDGGTSASAGEEQLARDRVKNLGYTVERSEQIAPYEGATLRSWLRMNSQPGQYVVEEWYRSPDR